MAFLRSFAFELGFALAISLALLVPTALAAEAGSGKCYSVFSSSEAVISGVDNIVYVETDVREKTPVKDVIYTLTWAENCVEAPKITDSTFSKYFMVDDTTKCTWKVSVNSELIGLPDYPNLQKKLETQVTFQDFTGIDYTTCTVTLTHNILDDNTQFPEPDFQTYVLDIEENFVPKYPISGFKTKVHDLDGELPNNKFTATTDPNCPLEATKTSYTSGAQAVSVFYQLKESLDFETEDQFQCEVIFQDLGTEPLTSTANINITVKDVADEPPEFTEDYYYAEVTSVLVTNEPLPVKPSDISAIDGDTSLDQAIKYTMTNVQLDVEGTTYFNINDKTGEVTLVQELDETFLLNERVLFFVTASDSSQTSTALLEVTLPPIPTTTATTTTTTEVTCEPCTCPTYTTETVTDCPTEGTCPSCPTDTTTEFTCPVTTCPSTPSESTCEPCPTDTTTCPVVTCPTTPGECTCDPCPTDTTTTTCPVVTCPTTPGECTCDPCPTDTTTTTCPVVTCPTTLGECTCDPCPTDTTTTTCPVVTCPTTPGECTCDPCPTDTTTDFTCPVVTCPTTPGECTCDPCPTDTTTECICPTTPSEFTCDPCPTDTTSKCTCPVITCPTTPGTDYTTITWGPDMPILTFKQSSYVGSIYPDNDKVYQVEVMDIGYEVIYDWSEDSPYFDINSSTGWITVKKDSTPAIGLYHLEAVATIKAAPSEQAKTQVNINVVSPTEEVLLIENGVIRSLVEEGEDEQDVSTFKISQPAEIVCITAASPLHMEERFKLVKQDYKNWNLRKTGVLDYEETQEITLVVEAFHEAVVCPEANDNIPSDLNRNQALAIISVSNKNDEKPAFSSEDLEVAYPTNEGLQRAVGPVVTVQAEDRDSTQMKYSITGTDAAKFAVDEETGEVYVLKSLNCDPDCKFEVTASDGDYDAQLNVKVIPLGMEHVFTLFMNGTTVSDVDAKLIQLSEDVGVQISKLYVSPMQPTVRQRMRQAREAQANLQVHVYGIQEGSLMSLDDLNSVLDQTSTSLEAEEFLEAVVFEAPVQDNTGLTVAVAILGTLLGLVLIVGIGFIIYKKKKSVSTHNPRPSPSPINTLGNAYQNNAYEKEGHVTQGSLGHKTNGSLNGFTSVQVHSTHDGDSPPMHRSSLANPSDSIQLRSIDSQQQQQGGLRRTNPSTPEYYGSSTPAPPPSFTRTTASSSTPEPFSSSSSSSPIYAEINKPKSTASAFTSSSSRPEKNVPLSDFSTSSKDKKPAVPKSHYEEVGNTKFSSLKASPPPRRSNNHNADDDDDDDVNEGVAYPGGKNAKFEDEPDEKKVAFKVMVDTKEIEAENMGPAQKKAEVEKLMEANRKKLQEEGDDEESAKL